MIKSLWNQPDLFYDLIFNTAREEARYTVKLNIVLM